ncbi:cytochrome [Moniliophthora roreri]|nr:cytochrome [Moniliophthora roreri]
MPPITLVLNHQMGQSDTTVDYDAPANKLPSHSWETDTSEGSGRDISKIVFSAAGSQMKSDIGENESFMEDLLGRKMASPSTLKPVSNISSC